MSDVHLLKHVGKKIRAARVVKEMTLEGLSANCDFEKAHLSRIENGLANPTVRSLCKICDALEINMADLFCD